jgi:hypothetical protein
MRLLEHLKAVKRVLSVRQDRTAPIKTGRETIYKLVKALLGCKINSRSELCTMPPISPVESIIMWYM